MKTSKGNLKVDWSGTGSHLREGGQPDVSGFEVMLELVEVHCELDDRDPIATHAKGSSWMVWKEREATDAMRAMLARQGLHSSGYGLHSLGVVH